MHKAKIFPRKVSNMDTCRWASIAAIRFSNLLQDLPMVTTVLFNLATCSESALNIWRNDSSSCWCCARPASKSATEFSWSIRNPRSLIHRPGIYPCREGKPCTFTLLFARKTSRRSVHLDAISLCCTFTNTRRHCEV